MTGVVTIIDKQAIIRLNELGKSTREISRELKIHRTTVTRYLLKEAKLSIFEIRAIEIDNWTEQDPRRAQELLPKLIFKLIYALSHKINRCDFPYEKAIQYPGYDGVLEVEEETKFFQKGKSVWEMGTDKNIKKKFEEDIIKRSEIPEKAKLNEIEFIFVTSRIWSHSISKDTIIEGKLKRYNWKNIRIYDAHTIEQWLQEAPSVLAWFIDVIGKKIDGLISVEKYWEKTGKETNPELKTNFFLSGRKKEAEELGEWLERGEKSIFLISDSSVESTLFIVSFLLESKNNKFLNKTIIVETEEAWNKVLNETFHDNLLIPIFNFNDVGYWSSDIKVLFPISRFSPLNKVKSKSIKLNRMKSHDFIKALELLGFKYEDAKKLRYTTKGLFVPFYRQITNNLFIKNPKWTRGSDFKKLISFMLVPVFDLSRTGDKKVIEKLSNENIEEYIESIRDYFGIEDSPILKFKTIYMIVSVREVWDNLFNFITEKDINCFKEIIIMVFETRDPKFELSSEKWWLAQLYKKEMEYSYNLMQGLIISLAMLKEMDKEENKFKIVSTKKFVDEILREVFSSIGDWQHWYTIVPFVPLMSEISSELILEILENNIDNFNSEFWKLFEIPEDIIVNNSYYMHILWTLEGLVWYRKYVKKAITLLIKIAEQEIDYKLQGNTPLSSLVDIFCIWKPQCNLNLNERNELLRQIVKDYPKTGWKLLERLFSKTVTSAIARPIWNEVDDIEIDVDIKSSLKNMVSICLASELKSYESWEVIVNNIEQFKKYYRFLTKKIDKDIKNLSIQDIEKLSQKLRGKIYVIMKFEKRQVLDIEKILDKIEYYLFDDILKYKYLFQVQTYIKDEVLLEEDVDYEKEKKYIFELRKKVFLEMYSSYKIEELLEFIKIIEDIRDLKILFVEIILKKEYNFKILRKIKNSNITLYYNILYELSYCHKNSDILEVLKGKTLQEKKEILKYSIANMELWKKIETLEKKIIDYYWENIDTPLEFLNRKEEKSFYIEKLIEYNRPFSAIKIIAYSSYNDIKQIIKILELTLIKESNVPEIENSKVKLLSQSYIRKIFEKIYQKEDLDEEIMRKLEFNYLKIFTQDFEPLFLVNYLKRKPEVYVELIIEVNEENDQIDCFLSKVFKGIKGCDVGEENEEAFKSWIRKAAENSEKNGIKSKFEWYLGKLLSRIPMGEDKVYPHKFVREYLEKNKSREIKDGFINGNTNEIIHSSIEEENKIRKYREDAEKLLVLYPITASILNELADLYEHFHIMRNEEEESIPFLF